MMSKHDCNSADPIPLGGCTDASIKGNQKPVNATPTCCALARLVHGTCDGIASAAAFLVLAPAAVVMTLFYSAEDGKESPAQVDEAPSCRAQRSPPQKPAMPKQPPRPRGNDLAA
ncbi:MAG: hypothetical protein NTU53_10615 [Planctomycetota bacterium]|nr:hypothetical protein [Planctomycetota bacterium]